MGSMRHDQIARDRSGKGARCVLTVAKQTLLGGLWRMATRGEDIVVAGQTLSEPDPRQLMGAPLVLAMAGRAGLRNLVVVLSQENGAMAGDALVGLDTSPGPVAALTALLERRVDLRQVPVHEHPFRAREGDPRCKGENRRRRSEHRKCR